MYSISDHHYFWFMDHMKAPHAQNLNQGSHLTIASVNAQFLQVLPPDPTAHNPGHPQPPGLTEITGATSYDYSNQLPFLGTCQQILPALSLFQKAVFPLLSNAGPLSYPSFQGFPPRIPPFLLRPPSSAYEPTQLFPT